MHDEGLGLNLGEQNDVREDIGPGRPSAHARAQASHACMHTHAPCTIKDMDYAVLHA